MNRRGFLGAVATLVTAITAKVKAAPTTPTIVVGLDAGMPGTDHMAYFYKGAFAPGPDKVILINKARPLTGGMFIPMSEYLKPLSGRDLEAFRRGYIDSK